MKYRFTLASVALAVICSGCENTDKSVKEYNSENSNKITACIDNNPSSHSVAVSEQAAYCLASVFGLPGNEEDFSAALEADVTTGNLVWTVWSDGNDYLNPTTPNLSYVLTINAQTGKLLAKEEYLTE